jgi:hypothetical protein
VNVDAVQSLLVEQRANLDIERLNSSASAS